MSTTRDEYLTVRQLTTLLGINIQSVRYYEREGLIPEPERTAGGHRLFSGDDVARLRFIRRAKDCGFSLREIKSLLALRGNEVATCSDVREFAKSKLDETRRELDAMKERCRHLEELIADCPGGDTGVDCCNILREFEGGENHRPAH